MRAPQAFPGPPENRFVGRPKKGPRPRRRSDGKYHIVGLPGKPIVLATRDEDEAWDLFGKKMLEIAEGGRAVTVNGAREYAILLADVIAEYGDGVEGAVKRNLTRLLGDLPLGRLTQDIAWIYRDMREDEFNENTGHTTSIGYIRKELTELRRMVNLYCNANGLAKPKVHMPAFVVSRDFLRVRDVARLLEVAINGWIWDPVTSDYKRCADGTLDRMPDEWIAEVWAVRRLILLIVNTASRTTTVLRARWYDNDDQTSNDEFPHLDFRVGNFNRRGNLERETSKRRPPVRLLPQMIRLCRSWECADRKRAVKTIVHHEDGRGARHDAWRLFRMVCRVAGFHDSVTFKTLRASCAVYLLEAGCTPEEAAEFLGNTERVLSKFYDRYLPEFSFAAVDALDSRSWRPRAKVQKAKAAADKATRRELEMT